MRSASDASKRRTITTLSYVFPSHWMRSTGSNPRAR